MQRRVVDDGVPYDAWSKNDWIIPTPGKAIDYDAVFNRIAADAEKFDLRETGFDRWGAVQIAQELEANGIECLKMGMGYASISAPTKELEKIVLSGKLKHGGHPVLKWMAENVEVKSDPAGNIKPVNPSRE